MKKKLTLKNFAIGFVTVAGFPIWFPIAVLMFLAAAICEIGMLIDEYFEEPPGAEVRLRDAGYE